MPDDKTNELVTRYVDLLARHQMRLFRYIHALVASVQDTEDVMQETSRILWERFDQFESGTNFYAWARKVAYYCILEHRRAKQRVPHMLPHDVIEILAVDAETFADREDDRQAALKHCLSKLRDVDQTLIHQRYESGVTLVQLAEQLQRPVNSLYKSLGRIRNSLLACIEIQLAGQQTEGGER